MGDQPLISIVAPVYGCRDCVEALTEEVRLAFEDKPLDWELILVDDRSPDKPWEMIQSLAAVDERVRGVRLTKNHGQHLAIWAGLKVARGSWVAVIDCDLQDDPAIIPDLYEKAMSEPVDAVVVDRGEWKDTWFRRFASRSFYKTMDVLAGVRLNNNVGNFGLYSRRMVKTLLEFPETEVFLPVMVTLTGLPRVSMSVDRDGRHAGQSAYSLGRLLRLAVAIIIRFSDRPLKLSVIVGLAFSTFSALFSFLLLVAWATGAFTVPGWTSLILSVWFLAGLILAVLGIHGFYMGRIFAEVKNRPRILVETTTFKEPTDG